MGIAAFAWGFGEATLFFFVPDVVLSFFALKDRHRALRCCLWSLAGALLGGTLMFLLATRWPVGTVAAVDHVPAVTATMLDRVRAGLAAHGPWAVFVGPPTGTPYKSYAALAPAAGIGLPAFLLVSVPARLIRFVFVVLLVGWLSRLTSARLSLRARAGVLAAFWIAFYAWYFATVG